jgi:hypothetical protein
MSDYLPVIFFSSFLYILKNTELRLGMTELPSHPSSNPLLTEEHSIVPLDIYSVIIEHLKEDLDSLKSFSLTSRAISGLCRPRSFEDVTIQANTARLADILVNSPETAKLVKKLKLVMVFEFCGFGSVIPPLLQSIAIAGTITTFSVDARHPWKGLLPDFKESFIHLLGQPSLRTIILKAFNNLPPSVFSACTDVTSVTIYDCSIVQESNPPVSPTSDGIQVLPLIESLSLNIRSMDPQKPPFNVAKFFDVSRLKKINPFMWNEKASYAQWNILQPAFSALEELVVVIPPGIGKRKANSQ